MKKRLTKLATMLLIAIVVVNVAIVPASAAYRNTGKSFRQKEGGFLGIGATEYTYKIFKDDVPRYIMFHSLDLCPPIWHSTRRGTTTLNQSYSEGYSEQTAEAFSVSAGYSVGVADALNMTAALTGGRTKTQGYNVGAAGSVGRTIPSEARTGYYKLTICYNFFRCRLDKYKSGSASKIGSEIVAIPYGVSYVSVLYSPTSDLSSFRKY